jgi:hypothetical protein
MAPEPRQVTVNAIAEHGLLVDESGHTETIMAERGQYQPTLPPATCSGGECFIGGAPRLIIEAGQPQQRMPMYVQPTPMPPPPTPVEILMVSPRRRFVFFLLCAVAVVVLGVLVWRAVARPSAKPHNPADMH